MAKKDYRKSAKFRAAVKAGMNAKKDTPQLIPIAKMNGKKTELGFLENIFQRKYQFWTYERCLRMIEMLKAGKKVEYVARYFNVKPAAIKNIVAELRRASKQSFTLEEYFKQNRPCRYGQKVVVK